MKKGMIFIFLILFISNAYADDNEIFGRSVTLEPNVLIIFDNSGSMGFCDIPADSSDYDCQECLREGWIWTGWNWKWGCKKYGAYFKKRITVAKEAVKKVIDNYAGKARIGVMVYNYYGNGGNDGGKLLVDCSKKDSYSGSDKIMDDSELQSYKNYLKGRIDALSPLYGTPLAGALAEAGRYYSGGASIFENTSYTSPIDYSCRKNYIIMMTDGKPEDDNGSSLLKQFVKDKKYINGEHLTASGDYPYQKPAFYKSGYPELEDVSKFLHDNDLIKDNDSNGNTSGTQFVSTYTIGFAFDENDAEMKKAENLLIKTAQNGGGEFVNAKTTEDLSNAFETFMSHVEKENTLFSSPAVPVSDSNKAYTGNYVYISMFQPDDGGKWKGNIKKYSLGNNRNVCSCGTSDKIMDNDGNISDSARSCWLKKDDATDGKNVAAGGVGGVLMKRDFSKNRRKIYTNKKSGTDLVDFDTNLSDSDISDSAVNYVRMEGDNLKWRLLDFNHSKPAVASLGTGDSLEKYIFAGSNGGMLHCFSDSDGSEKWAFVPREQYKRLESLEYSKDHLYFMDGSPTIGEFDSNKFLIIGERRGGNNYYCLDIKDIDSPKYKYKYTSDAQSWKRPEPVEIALGESTSKYAFLLTGGYDTGYDDGKVPSSPKGGSVFTIDAENGTRQANDLFFSSTNTTGMGPSIVSAFVIDTADDGRDVVNLIYAGDLGGNVFSFRDDFNNKGQVDGICDGNWVSRRLFRVKSSGKRIFYEADLLKDVYRYYSKKDDKWQSIKGEMIFFGTGDRAHPLSTSEENYFYGIKNDWHNTDLDVNKKVSDLSELALDPRSKEKDASKVDVIVDGSDVRIENNVYITEPGEESIGTKVGYVHNRGWYFKLVAKGEKCLSTPIVYKGVVYFTTFTPMDSENSNPDPCSPDTLKNGIARVYAVDWRTGDPKYNLNKNNDSKDENGNPVIVKDNTDRYFGFKILGGIAPSPQIVINEDGAGLLVGPVSEMNGKMDIDNRPHLFYWKLGN